MPKRTL